ncbi:hypothetical protein AVEN_236882-1 [Araneus ventricosus]|uniref:Uncharacterized protein n=1 Tax=Araneus ventricosus TaxID=182803 RepID=A0A4Y2FZL7_ARAVE|nr:hypothetical protein AVEN_236882-1 [Araneus ventricosus]
MWKDTVRMHSVEECKGVPFVFPHGQFAVESDCQSSIIFSLKFDFRKEIGSLTESGSLSDSEASFANLSASTGHSLDCPLEL